MPHPPPRSRCSFVMRTKALRDIAIKIIGVQRVGAASRGLSAPCAGQTAARLWAPRNDRHDASAAKMFGGTRCSTSRFATKARCRGRQYARKLIADAAKIIAAIDQDDTESVDEATTSR